MKKNVLFFFFVILFPLVAYSSGNDAVANPAAVVEEGDVRFTVLTPRVIRMEWDSLHRFTDERSFIVINRNLPVPEFKKIIRGGKLTIRTDELELTYKLNTGKFSKENLEIKYLNKKRAFIATSFVQLLKDNGYHTIHCGKAHWGAIDTPGESPYHFGFETNIAGHAAGGPATYLSEGF